MLNFILVSFHFKILSNLFNERLVTRDGQTENKNKIKQTIGIGKIKNKKV
jgi:hypothetical protein